jgi:glycosyltransferase involved in cell wall biosynthesis
VRGWVIVSGDFVPHGGMDLANLELARFLAREDPVHLVAHRVSEDVAALTNVTVHRVSRPLGRNLFGKPFLAAAGKRWGKRLGRAGHRVIVNGGNCSFPDVNWVHCVHTAYPAYPGGGLIRRLKARVLHRCDRRSERNAIARARVVICNSRRTARDVVELLGIDASRVRVIYLGCNPARLQRIDAAIRAENRKRLGWEERPWVGFVGQFGNRVKGFDTLYSAWRVLCDDPAWDANLAVIGDGPDRSSWTARAAADGLTNRIRFLGFRNDVPDILACCDVLAAPSRYDAYGLAVHEAICRGIPVVVSSAAGVSERYAPDLLGLILGNPEDADELAERLRAWRNDHESWVALIRPLSDELRSRSWTDMARDIRAAVLES